MGYNRAYERAVAGRESELERVLEAAQEAQEARYGTQEEREREAAEASEREYLWHLEREQESLAAAWRLVRQARAIGWVDATAEYCQPWQDWQDYSWEHEVMAKAQDIFLAAQLLAEDALAKMAA